jgi:3-oxoacyl-[acyl-carrier-protein] synthase-1
VAITGIGLVTPVGLSALPAVAALRAGISRLEILDDYEVLDPDDTQGSPSGARVPIVTAAKSDVERLASMACPALQEALRSAAVPPDAEVRVRCGVAVPPHAARIVDRQAELAAPLAETLARGNWRGNIELVPAGRAAAIQALRRAAAEVRPGGPVWVVGGVDCWSDHPGLQYLDENRRLRSGIRGSGVLPGEAAGFVVLAPAGAAGANELARISAAAGAQEPTPIDEPTRAVPLSEVLLALGVRDSRPLVVCDLNGERHRAHEWAFASTRALRWEGDLREWTPAEGIGDAGAAMGAVCLAVAAIAIARGYARAAEVLVCGASDEGAREAALLRAAPGGAA